MNAEPINAEQPAHVRPSFFSTRWLAAGGAAVLGGVIGIALLLQHGGAPACAAVPTGTTKHSGKATFYDLGGNLGNCSFPSAPDDDLFVALGNSEYDGAAACGSYLDVTGPKGKVRVKVIDRCPECEEGHLDLSRTAFKRIADEVQGIVPITYRSVVDPPTPGKLSIRFKDGTSQFFFAVLIDNHGNPLKSVKVGGRAAKRADFNFWILDGGAGPGPFSITMTDVYGNKATATGVKLRPEQTQTTSVRLSGGGGTAVVEQAPPRSKKSRDTSSKSRQAPRAAATSTAAVPDEVAPPRTEPDVATSRPAVQPYVEGATPSGLVTPADVAVGGATGSGDAVGAGGAEVQLAGANTSCK